MKSWYRRDEHALQAAETLATIASLKTAFDYPVQDFYHAWLQMLLNMDRNTLWGAAGGMVFEHDTSWDARDRFAWVAEHATTASAGALRALVGPGDGPAPFNPLNWQRHDPVELPGLGLCQPQLPACGTTATLPAAEKTASIALPATIETTFYTARIDPVTGTLTSLKLKPSGREMLGGAGNVLVAEKHSGQGDPGDFTDARPRRARLRTSSDHPSAISVTESPLAITVEAGGTFYGGGKLRRVTRFYKQYPRIDFQTELNDLPDGTVVVAEFPLAETPKEIRRGIPFGFSRDDDWVQGIAPAVRWSDYTLPSGGGVALLDRGLTGREINGKTPVVYLYNATEKYYGYPNPWLSGKGYHRFEYALAVHDAAWADARLPQMAWEYNCPPLLVRGCAAAQPQSFLQTSNNLILEVMRRDGPDIEMRLVECQGIAGKGQVTLNLPHQAAALTDMLGAHPQKLAGGPTYTFPVRPQQIVTLRCRTAAGVAEVKPLTDWTELVPANKRAALKQYLPDRKGHPPLGQ